MLHLSVGNGMLTWNSTGLRRANERPKSPVKVSGKNRVRGLRESPAGKEKETSEGHRKERTGLTRSLARRRRVIQVEGRTAQDSS